ncbi:MAG TPA: hypothetical protein VGG04_09480 [Candidatus Sulfotelmatobacter sp.]
MISEIVAEAGNENVPLSEVERKMLYFTESGWTLPDIMKISDDFDRDYDQDEYEKKIAKLVAKADRRIRRGLREDYDKWWAAIRLLEREDHYLSVMIRSAALRPRGDQFRLFVTAIAIVSCFLAWIFVSIKLNIPIPSRETISFLVWVGVASLFVVYFVLRLALGKKKIDAFISAVLGNLLKFFQRITGNV